MAFDLSVRLGLCPAADAARVRRHLAAIGLPTGLDAVGGQAWSVADLIDHMRRDKKVAGGKTHFVLVRGIGQAFVSRDVDPKDVEALIAGQLAA